MDWWRGSYKLRALARFFAVKSVRVGDAVWNLNIWGANVRPNKLFQKQDGGELSSPSVYVPRITNKHVCRFNWTNGSIIDSHFADARVVGRN
jgi:hypothetical protein